MLWRMPRASAMLISDAPPWVMNGSGMPVTGMIPRTIPTLTSIWKRSIAADAAGEHHAERVLRAPADEEDAPDQRDEQQEHDDRPDEPELLGRTANTKSVACTGSSPSAFWAPFVSPLPKKPPEPTAICDWSSW